MRENPREEKKGSRGYPRISRSTLKLVSGLKSLKDLKLQAGKEFRVVVADSRPHYEGRAMLSKLLAHGIPCTYLQLNALCYSMQASSVRDSQLWHVIWQKSVLLSYGLGTYFENADD